MWHTVKDCKIVVFFGVLCFTTVQFRVPPGSYMMAHAWMGRYSRQVFMCDESLDRRMNLTMAVC